MSKTFMEIALDEANRAFRRGEVPIGAVIVHNNKVIAQDGNRTIELNDPTAHAEILVIKKACSLVKSQRIPECDLYVTLEPCTMCAGAISFARIRRLYFGAEDQKGGAIVHGPRFFESASCHHNPEFYSGLCELQSQAVLQEFFSKKR